MMTQGNVDKKKRYNISLDEQTKQELIRIANECGYGSVSSAIRVLVKKYGKYETEDFTTKAIS